MVCNPPERLRYHRDSKTFGRSRRVRCRRRGCYLLWSKAVRARLCVLMISNKSLHAWRLSNIPSSKSLDDAMHNRYVSSFDVVNHNVAYVDLPSPVPQYNEVSSCHSGLHGAGEHYHDRRRAVRNDSHSFEYHKCGAEHECEIEQLRSHFTRV